MNTIFKTAGLAGLLISQAAWAQGPAPVTEASASASPPAFASPSATRDVGKAATPVPTATPALNSTELAVPTKNIAEALLPTTSPAPTPASVAKASAKDDDEEVKFYGNRKRAERKDKKIYNGYFGVEAGLAQASGTYLPLGSGLAYGLTAGVDTPLFGLGLTFQHESLSVMHTDDNQSISQLMLELNFFSYLLLNGGLQIGDVLQDVRGATINSFGIGLHAGFDLHFSEEWTAGLAASWTFVTQNSDKHSLFNIVIPIKYWF